MLWWFWKIFGARQIQTNKQTNKQINKHAYIRDRLFECHHTTSVWQAMQFNHLSGHPCRPAFNVSSYMPSHDWRCWFVFTSEPHWQSGEFYYYFPFCCCSLPWRALTQKLIAWDCMGVCVFVWPCKALFRLQNFAQKSAVKFKQIKDVKRKLWGEERGGGRLGEG